MAVDGWIWLRMAGDGYGLLGIAMDGWRWLWIAGDSYGCMEMAMDSCRLLWVSFYWKLDITCQY